MQRSVPNPIRGIHASPAVEQKPAAGHVVAPGGSVQRCAGNVVRVLQVGTRIKKDFYHLFEILFV